MSNELTKKAVEMLLKGATLVSDPCPYCKGVRIMKSGNALCVNCGKEGKQELVEDHRPQTAEKKTDTTDNLDQKIKDLTIQLNQEKDLEKQKQILQAINDIISIKERLGKI